MAKNKVNKAISFIKLESDGKDVRIRIEGEQQLLAKLVCTAMEKVENFAPVIVTASEAYKSYQAKLQNENQEGKEA